MFTLSKKSKSNLFSVHPDLIKVVEHAITITPIDFCVLEGLRTHDRQVELVKTGKSKTMNSRHLTGHAVDLGALPNGKLSWDMQYYKELSLYVKQAASQLNIPIEWGGDWKTFKDGPHYQLPWKYYP
jgi:peptidoglycan L-alanyl-D-glutamate endopeptidase CwlK